MDKHLRRGNTVQPLRTKLAAIKNAFSEAYSSINRKLLHKLEIMVTINTKRLEMHHSTEEKVLLVLVVAVCLILYVFMLFATTNTVTSVSAVDADGIGVYWDSDCSDRVSSIDWETLTPGSVKSVVVYVRNENEEPIYLNMSTANWNPSNASQYITLRWDYSEQWMNPGEVLQITLSLSVSRYIEGISSFSFDILITGSTSLPGDVNGDGVVNDLDLFLLTQAYESSPGDPNWNPDCDFDADNHVGYSDLFILATNYGGVA